MAFRKDPNAMTAEVLKSIKNTAATLGMSAQEQFVHVKGMVGEKVREIQYQAEDKLQGLTVDTGLGTLTGHTGHTEKSGGGKESMGVARKRQSGHEGHKETQDSQTVEHGNMNQRGDLRQDIENRARNTVLIKVIMLVI